MGGRGSSSGKSGIGVSNQIKKEMIDAGLKSRLKGVQRDAKLGTGNFSYKNAKAIGRTEAENMNVLKVHERGNNVLIEGMYKGEHVFYAGKQSDGTVKKIKDKLKTAKTKQVEESKERRPEIRVTSTYNRWKNNNDKNFAAWFGNR